MIANGQTVQAQSYIFASEDNGLDVVAHPIGYDGTGGVLNVSVGIDPTSVNYADMIISTQNVVNTWNRLESTTGNLSFGLPSNTFDFESVLLHEVGHSLGLGHVNIGSAGGAGSDYSISTQGVNGQFNFNPGADGIIGSSDDVRGDDPSLNYF